MTREGEYRKERRKAYSAFLAQEAVQRSEIENNPRLKVMRKTLLTNFDEEEAHLDRLRDHFQEPTLDEWLEQNSDRS